MNNIEMVDAWKQGFAPCGENKRSMVICGSLTRREPVKKAALRRLVAPSMMSVFVLFAHVACVARSPATAPAIRIIDPQEGAVVKGNAVLAGAAFVLVTVKVSNFTLQEPNNGKNPNTGHIHYWIDGITSGSIAPPTPETTVTIFVPSGQHKIRAELVQDDHASLAEGYEGKIVRQLPPDDSFARRPTMDTITIVVGK
jgi:hypothetical protein